MRGGQAARVILKRGVFTKKGQFDHAGWTVTLFADNYFGQTPVWVVLGPIVDLVTVDEHDDVGILFDGS